MSKTRPPVSKWVRLLRKLSRRRHARQLRRQRLSSSAYSTRRSNIGSWGAEGPWVLQASKVRKRYKARKGNNHRKRNKAWKRKWIRENRKRGKVSKALPRQKKVCHFSWLFEIVSFLICTCCTGRSVGDLSIPTAGR